MTETAREMTFEEMDPSCVKKSECWISGVDDGHLPSMEVTFALITELRTCIKRAQNENSALREKAERENPKPCDGCGFQRMPERGACWGCTRNRMVFADNYTPKGAER